MKKSFKVAGIYYDLSLQFVPEKKLNPHNPGADEDTTQAEYSHYWGTIEIINNLPPEVRKHNFYHEVAHHILDTLEKIKDEENQCDLLGAYLLRLVDEKEKINKILKG